MGMVILGPQHNDEAGAHPMITVLRCSDQTMDTTEVTPEIKELIEFIDAAVILLSKNFSLTDLSDGVAFLRQIRQDLREQQGGQHLWDKDNPLVGKLVEGWAVQEPTTGQAIIFYAVLVVEGKLALAKQADLAGGQR